MSLTALFLLPDSFDLMPPRRGRPKVADLPDERARHIECAALRLKVGLSVAKVAGALGISRATVYLWTNAALSYDDPEAEGLRRLVGRSN